MFDLIVIIDVLIIIIIIDVWVAMFWGVMHLYICEYMIVDSYLTLALDNMFMQHYM